MTDTVEQRLKELGLELPAIGTPVANYVPYVRTGNLLYLSGQVALDADGTLIAGQVGAEYTIEEAQALARRAGLYLVAAAKSAIASLDDIVRVVKVNGYVNAVPGFTQQPAVINGCSDLLVALFGERGRHARAAIGAGGLPGNAPVEVEAIFEVK